MLGIAEPSGALRANDGTTRGAIDRDASLDSSRVAEAFDLRAFVSQALHRKTRLVSLSDWLQSHFGIAPEFARTARFAAGVTCGYEDPSRLGVDRWLAMLAARQLSNRPFIVFGLGTAGTADFVDGDGVHKGGFIVPGLRLMTEALFAGTADVHVDVRSVEQSRARNEYTERGEARCDVDARGLRQRLDQALRCNVYRYAASSI